jgi:Asp-tRNA(Asn)/Glu-tRNA(Gln) amidotransferase A subunit family amidase
MYSAVDYIQAQRARSLGIAAMADLFKTVDVIVTPTTGTQSRITNLTGHPAVIVPNGVRGDDAPEPFLAEDGSADNVGGPGTPVSITFLGGLYDDATLAAFARAYQDASGFARLHPGI